MSEVTPSSLPESPQAGQRAVQWLVGSMLIIAPLFRSGKPALAVMTLELLAVCVLVLVLWQPGKRLISAWEAIALALLFAVPLLYLVPFPTYLAAWLPGREPYLAGLSIIDDTAMGHLTRLSLYPLQTEAALLLLMVPAAVFLGTRSLDLDRALQLVLLMLGIGACQALLGLVQYGATEGSPALFGMSFAGVSRAMGSYTNPDHLAGLLEMLLPIALALVLFSVGRKHHDDRQGWRARVAFASSVRGHAAIAYGVIALLLLLGIIFTRSRGGILVGILGILLSTVAFSRRIGGNNVYGPTGTVVTLAIGAGIAIGLVPVLDRFSVDAAVSDARWTIFSATLRGIGALFPIGSGPGTYPDVFPAFQPLQLGQWFINHAHNDYLEWLFEAGLIAAALIALLLGLYVRQWLKIRASGSWSRFRFVQVGAGIGILLLLLHSLGDFNLHIPANITYLAFLMGIFFADPAPAVEPATPRRRRTPDLESSDALSPVALASARAAPPPDQIRNPFLDD